MPTSVKSRAKSNGAVGGGRGAGSDEPFVWTSPDGVEITVRSLSKPFATSGELRAHRNDNPIELAYWIIEQDCNKEQLAAIDALTMEQFNDDFSQAWAEHSGIDVGK